jgi:hypothetical protein
MGKLFSTGALVVLLSGCNGAGGGLEGVWLFELVPMSTPECDTEITENFKDAKPAETDTFEEWTFSTEGENSPIAGFAQFAAAKNGEMIMVFDGAIYRGASEKSDWTFTWEGTTDEVNSQEHNAGYTYRISQVAASTRTFTFSLQKGMLSGGAWKLATDEDTLWEETDEWDVSNNVLVGQIPAPNYLVDEFGALYINQPNKRDCNDALCDIQLVQTCETSAAFTGYWTGYSEEGAYDGINDALQPAGYNP